MNRFNEIKNDVVMLYDPKTHASITKFGNAILQECLDILNKPDNIGRRDLDWNLVFKEHFFKETK